MTDEQHTDAPKGDVTILEPSRPQQVVARRVAEAKATVPEVVTATEADMEAAVALDVPAGALVLKAAALALRETPRANAAYRDGHFELYSRVNVGLAVAAQDALVFPTIHDADTAPLGEIARLSDDLTQRAQAGALSPAETRGGTFTIFRAGAHGATRLTPILNAPQAANLAVGAVRVLPRVVDGQIVARHVVELTLVSDHRILYGPDAEQFLARIRAHLEAPEALTR